ncbi:L-histidine N(alpha)-methyltransferase [Rubrivivax gelatinosus]|uniref:L-histidine N(alpha)-methyltransferase n=1 Tax=Rubrivivax gelatinosus TaxID=28068 RepID=UPI0019033E2F|nr:L-histidine N(alpha)-methyltransferase [Rubrivivax gelatinosus]MBK1612611.1 L-histidine N(alpha)-methyltransferase [Rubrivivax gelatinosus]
MSFAEEFVAGLRTRHIAPKWFYDAEGSRLFERICLLPEYYPTRTELALLDRHAPEFAARIGTGAEIVEFGAGASVKVRLLLDALESPRRFVPIDISGDYLAEAAATLRADYPGLAVEPLAGDFTRDLVLPLAAGRRIGFFPGSSIGNFEPEAAQALLARFRQWLGGGALLIGVDLFKEPAELHAAYNDAQGVTAAFNLNLLARANRELGADIDLGGWAHAAFYHPPLRRIEMHLVSRRRQVLQVGGERFEFDEGDSLHTENSYKYGVEGFRALARRAGFEPGPVWTDAARRFSLHWLEPANPA